MRRGRKGWGSGPRTQLVALSRFLLSLALMHGLVSSPLLVECIRADGIVIMELLGNDPCRQAATEPASDAGPAAAATYRELADHSQPCVDMISENAAVAHTNMGLQQASAPAAGARAGTAASLSAHYDLRLQRALFKLPREPVCIRILNPESISCLRI